MKKASLRTSGLLLLSLLCLTACQPIAPVSTINASAVTTANQEQCTLATLKGRYLFAASGTILPPAFGVTEPTPGADAGFHIFNGAPGRVGPPMPPCPADIHEAWRDWITRGWFDGESEGYPFWGNLHHTQSWWNYRHLENILFVHYNDLLNALPYEIRRIARFLDIPLSDEGMATILPALSLESMRRNGERTLPAPEWIWKEGAQTFFFKGTNDRWRDVLTAEEVAMYEETATRVLTPVCRAWLERGRIALGSSNVDTAQATL